MGNTEQKKGFRFILMDISKTKILSIDSLKIGYAYGKRQKILLPPLAASAYKGELIAVIGRNGIGKSTLLRTIIGLQPSYGGKIIIMGKKISEYSRLEMAQQIGYISTDVVKVSNMRVRDLVALGRFPHTNWTGKITGKDHEVITESINKAGMSGFENRLISELSDGERQRAMIARVLAQDTEVMLMDEPTAFLDISSRFEVVNLMLELSKKGKTIIFSTHDFNIAVDQADKIWLILENELTEGAPEDLVLNGSFDHLFDTSVVKFNNEDGSFSFRKENRSKIYIAGDGKMKFWTEKAVIRAGYAVSDTRTPVSIQVPTENNKKWVIFSGDSSVILNSLYDLVCRLEKGT
jgi:iron complex transport system ATP-binding protein